MWSRKKVGLSIQICGETLSNMDFHGRLRRRRSPSLQAGASVLRTRVHTHVSVGEGISLLLEGTSERATFIRDYTEQAVSV